MTVTHVIVKQIFYMITINHFWLKVKAYFGTPKKFVQAVMPWRDRSFDMMFLLHGVCLVGALGAVHPILGDGMGWLLAHGTTAVAI